MNCLSSPQQEFNPPPAGGYFDSVLVSEVAPVMTNNPPKTRKRR